MLEFGSSFQRGGFAPDRSSMTLVVEDLPPVIVVSGSFELGTSGVERLRPEGPSPTVDKTVNNATRFVWWAFPPNSSIGIQSTAATTMSVFGGEAGFTGSVGSFTLVVASPEKFLMPMNKDKRLGTSPGRLMLPGASPIIVNRALISSCGKEPEGKPRIQILASEMLPKAASPSGIFERSSK